MQTFIRITSEELKQIIKTLKKSEGMKRLGKRIEDAYQDRDTDVEIIGEDDEEEEEDDHWDQVEAIVPPF